MLKQIENRGSMVALCVVALLIIFSMIGYFQGDEAGRTSVTDRYALRHYENATAYIQEACIGGDPQNLTPCIEDAIRASGEYRRAELELTAQEEMSDWSKWLLFLSIISTALTIAGLVYIRRTLLATQEMTKETRDLGHVEVRAYLSVKKIVLREQIKVRNAVKVRIEFENTGNSPAHGACIMAQAKVMMKDSAEFKDHCFDIEEVHLDGSLGIGSRCSVEIFREADIAKFSPSVAMDDLIAKDKAVIVVWGRVDYFDVFSSRDVRQTNFRYICSKRTYRSGKSFSPTSLGNDAT